MTGAPTFAFLPQKVFFPELFQFWEGKKNIRIFDKKIDSPKIFSFAALSLSAVIFNSPRQAKSSSSHEIGGVLPVSVSMSLLSDSGSGSFGAEGSWEDADSLTGQTNSAFSKAASDALFLLFLILLCSSRSWLKLELKRLMLVSFLRYFSPRMFPSSILILSWYTFLNATKSFKFVSGLGGLGGWWGGMVELEMEVEMKMVKMWRVALPLGEGSRRFGGDRGFKNMIILYKKISIAAMVDRLCKNSILDKFSRLSFQYNKREKKCGFQFRYTGWQNWWLCLQLKQSWLKIANLLSNWDRVVRYLQTCILIGQEIQLRSSCPMRASELYLLSDQNVSL